MHSRERSSYLGSILRETQSNLTRHTLISSAAILTIVAALLILGLFIVFSGNISRFTQTTQESLQVKIFLKDGLMQEEKDKIYDTLDSNPDISAVEFESKAQAFENFSQDLNDYSDLLSEYSPENNPLPESYIVQAISIDKLQDIVDSTETFADDIEYVRYQEKFYDSVKKFTDFVDIISISLLVAMSVIAFFLIFNTIRLTVANRQEEIEIMKSLGATSFFITTPFVLTGVILGIISAIIASLLLCIFYYYIVGFLNGSLSSTIQDYIVSPTFILLISIGSFLIYGLFIGWFGSVIATRRYLKY